MHACARNIKDIVTNIFFLCIYYRIALLIMMDSLTPIIQYVTISITFSLFRFLRQYSNNLIFGTIPAAMFDPKSIFESEVYGYKSCKPGRLNMLWKLSDPETRRWCIQQAARKAILKKAAQLAQCGSPHTSLCLQNRPFTPTVYAGKYRNFACIRRTRI